MRLPADGGNGSGADEAGGNGQGSNESGGTSSGNRSGDGGGGSSGAGSGADDGATAPTTAAASPACGNTLRQDARDVDSQLAPVAAGAGGAGAGAGAATASLAADMEQDTRGCWRGAGVPGEQAAMPPLPAEQQRHGHKDQARQHSPDSPAALLEDGVAIPPIKRTRSQ